MAGGHPPLKNGFNLILLYTAKRGIKTHLFIMQYTLFENRKESSPKTAPLAITVRPASLNDFIGQENIIGEGKLLRRLIVSDQVASLIFYGPSGCGKTTLANIICNITKSNCKRINATSSNTAELRQIIDESQKIFSMNGKKTVLLIDEIHRFNRMQQDVLMPFIESGNPILIGTTTLNPFFYINSALLSRSHVFEFRSLKNEDIFKILKRAAQNEIFNKTTIEEQALVFLSEICDGDARKALNALEVGILSTQPDNNGYINITLDIAKESIQKKMVSYDKDQDGHYDTISAFIKSMRGSDPDATLYWLAKMLYAGEDIRFITRRIVICASEDVGNADPQAVIVATSCMQAAEMVGMPEARIILAQAAVYVACAPKSNAAYLGIEKAIDDVKNSRIQEVPDHLKDASYKSASKLGRGENYKYAHDYKRHYVKQEYMPVHKKYYVPTNIGYEEKIKKWLQGLAGINNQKKT